VLPSPNEDEACDPEICTKNKEVAGPCKNFESLVTVYLVTFKKVVHCTSDGKSKGTHKVNQWGDE